MRIAVLLGFLGTFFSSAGWSQDDVVKASSSSIGDTDRGEQIFQVCGQCHTTVPNVHGIGPSLVGIVGKEPGQAAEFQYSDGMKVFAATGAVWDDETIDAYVQRPRRVVEGTTMPFRSLRNPKDRRDLIAYLNQL